MSHANVFSPFRGKVNQFIIPMLHFKVQSSEASEPKKSVDAETPIEYTAIKKNRTQPQYKVSIPEESRAYTPPKINIKKPDMEDGVSSLSLSSIGLKKEAERKSSSKEVAINESNDKFTQESFMKVWKTYIEEKNNQGKNNIAAQLEMSQPELLGDHKILLKTTSSLSKLELTEELPPLMCFLSKALNNYKITFEIKVVTQKSDEYLCGNKEKYDYLKKINPEIEVLKNVFDLDI